MSTPKVIYDGQIEFPIIPQPTIDGNPVLVVDFEIENKQWVGTNKLASKGSVPTIGSFIEHFGLRFCICGFKSVKGNQFQLTLTAALFGTTESATDNRS